MSWRRDSDANVEDADGDGPVEGPSNRERTSDGTVNEMADIAPIEAAS